MEKNPNAKQNNKSVSNTTVISQKSTGINKATVVDEDRSKELMKSGYVGKNGDNDDEDELENFGLSNVKYEPMF